MHVRKKRLRAAPLEEPSKMPDESQRHLKEFGGPDVRLEGFVDRVSLERALAALTGVCKTVFVLHDVHGFKHHEIAEILRCSVASSKGQLHRARTRLRQLLRSGLTEMPLVFRSVTEPDMTASAC